MPGILRTRVGYAGGTTPSPTYKSIGDHAEALELDFDPSVISYEEILALFWELHSPTSPPWKRQYMSAILTHDDGQMATAKESMAAASARFGAEVSTELATLREFTWAEDYHQKYRLQRHKAMTQELVGMFDSFADFVNSPAATRLNGYLAGYGDASKVADEVGAWGLSERMQAEVLATVQGKASRRR